MYNKTTMPSQVFYRKWRPRTLAEVVGQEHVTSTLRNAIKSGRVAHAYLFCGPRGTGKTSTGRILAKAVNCLNNIDGEPCNTCTMCQAFNEGSAIDIIEIDAASNRGIDEIRDLKEKVNYAPNIGRFKVYIIDEVHMITKEGFNAFLKTLEEPPPHVIFILATTDPHKVLPTILSRCQRFDFHRLSQSAVIEKLKFISEKEAINIEPEALRLIARVTTGSLRDAENLLEQSVAYYGHEISLSQVQSMLGITNDPRSMELVKHIIDKDITRGMKTITAVSADGLDLQQFNRELVSHLRNLLLVKSNSAEVVDVTKEDLEELRKLALNTNLDYLLNAIKFFGELDFRKDSYSPLPLELAFIDTILSQSEQKEAKEKTTPAVKQQPVATGTAKIKKQEYKLAPAADSIISPETAVEFSGDKTESIIKSPPVVISEQGDLDEISYIKKEWRNFINSLKGEGSMGNLDAFLRSASEPLRIEDNVLTIGFYYKFQRDYIDDPKYRFLVEKKLLEVFKKPYKIKCVMTERKKDTEAHKKDQSSVLTELALKRGAKMIDQKNNMEEK